MKKVMLMAAIAAALVSCQSKGKQNQALLDEGVFEIAGNDSSAVAIYEGIIPAADGSGIEYVLSVDSIGPDGESGYTLVATYPDTQHPGKSKSVTSKGKKEVVKKQVKNQTKTGYKLTPGDGNPPIYFIVVNDTTLRLSNGNLEELVDDQSYDIYQIKGQ